MGNDGGSIPTRRELVKEAARNPTTTEIKQAQQEQEEHYWTTDPLSNRPLQRPVVSDSSGRLYNKDAVLEFLLPADADDAAAAQRKADAETVLRGAVRSLRDVVEVKFAVDEEDSNSSSSSGGGDDKEKKQKKNGSGGNGGSKETWICPVTRETLGPGTKAVYLVPCGHAFAGSVIKEAGADGTCLQCGEACAPNDVIPIVPTAEEDVARLQLRIKALKEKGLAHSLKKAPGGKKRKKGAAENGEAAETKAKKREAAAAAAAAADGIKNSATASLTAKVLAEQEERNKRRKMENNENLNSLFSSKDPKKFGKNSDFMSRGFDIPAQAKR